MDILVGYAGLAISFVMFAIILLLVFIKANNISWKTKLVTIPVVLAYSILLYYTPGQFMGYASDNIEGVGQVIVLEYHVVESEALYFLVIDYNKQNINAMIPRPTDATKSTAPRLYKIIYNSEAHKQIIEAWDARKKSKNRLAVTVNLDRLKGIELLTPAQKPFKLFDPAEMLKKEPDE